MNTRDRSRWLAERVRAERDRHPTVDALFEMADHDAEVGGTIMAGALAYRFFIWLLPLALVAVAGLGVTAHAASRSPESVARSAGIAGLVSTSVANAADSPARWYALLIGIPLLLYATRTLLKTLVVTHRLVWADARDTVPKPSVAATLELLAALIGVLVISSLVFSGRSLPLAAGALAALLAPVPFAALWLAVSLRLPHREVGWRHLAPGALVFGVGVEVMHVAITYVIAPQASSKQGTYGSLGIAAVLLLGLFLFSRVIIAAAVLNARLSLGARSSDPPASDARTDPDREAPTNLP